MVPRPGVEPGLRSEANHDHFKPKTAMFARVSQLRTLLSGGRFSLSFAIGCQTSAKWHVNRLSPSESQTVIKVEVSALSLSGDVSGCTFSRIASRLCANTAGAMLR
jgi:hypothetical protein